MQSSPVLPAIIGDKKDEKNLTNIKKYLDDNLSPRQLEAVKDMAYKIGKVGMSMQEACLLARVTKDEFTMWCEIHPLIADFFKIQALEYKFSLMEITSAQARENKDIKLATWLLEKQFAEDYDNTVKKEQMKFNRSIQDDVLSVAISFVRQSNIRATPVNESAGDAITGKVHDVKFKDLNEILK